MGEEQQDYAKVCFVCRTTKKADEMIQIGARVPLFKHKECDHSRTCFICGDEVMEKRTVGNKLNYTILDGVRIAGGYVRHHYCEAGSSNWYFNPVSQVSPFRGLFAHHDERKAEEMAVKKKTGKDIQKAIKRNKNLTDKQKEIKDIIGRVKYLRYMDTNPNAKVSWVISVNGISVERKAGDKTVTLKVKGEKPAKLTPDKAIKELEAHFSNESAV